MKQLALFAVFLGLLGCGGASKKNVESPAPPTLSEQAYTHYLRGQVAYFRGDYQEARIQLVAAKREAPDQAPISRALARAHYDAGDRIAAERESAWALRRWPADSQVWKQSGILHARARNFSGAQRALKVAISLGARSDATYLALGRALMHAGSPGAAKAAFRKVIAREEGSAEGHYQLALLLYREENYEDASKHAGHATTQGPYDLRAWALLADSLRAQGRNAEAADVLRHPFDRSRGRAGVGRGLFVELLDLGARSHALASVAILDRDDLAPDTRIAMGHWLLLAGDFEGALALAGRLDGPNPKTAAIVELRSRALRALHRNDEAIGQLRAIGKDSARYPLVRAMLAELLADMGEFQEAQAVVSAARKEHEDDPDLVMAHAAVAERAGDIGRARDLLSAAIARHPKAERPLFALAEVEMRSGRAAQAIAVIAPLLQDNPRNFAALNYIGYTLIGNPAECERARDLLLRALELAPDSAFVLDSYGWFLLKNGEHKKAAPLIERALRLTPTEPELILHLAELRWLEGRQREAERLLTRAHSLSLTAHAKEAVVAVRKRLSQQLPSRKP